MVRYFANKFFYLLVSLFILITATFFLMKAIPGNPFLSEKAVSPINQREAISSVWFG